MPNVAVYICLSFVRQSFVLIVFLFKIKFNSFELLSKSTKNRFALPGWEVPFPGMNSRSNWRYFYANIFCVLFQFCQFFDRHNHPNIKALKNHGINFNKIYLYFESWLGTLQLSRRRSAVWGVGQVPCNYPVTKASLFT